MKPGRPDGSAARAAELGAPARPRRAAGLIALLDRIALEPQNLTAIEGVEEGIDRHLLDSLVALAHPRLAGADGRRRRRAAAPASPGWRSRRPARSWP